MKDVPPPRCYTVMGRWALWLLRRVSSVVWRAAADRPCRARSAETALNGAGPPAVREQPRSGDGRRTSAVGSTCYAYRNADPQSNPTIAIAIFIATNRSNRPASDPFPSRPNGTGTHGPYHGKTFFQAQLNSCTLVLPCRCLIFAPGTPHRPDTYTVSGTLQPIRLSQ